MTDQKQNTPTPSIHFGVISLFPEVFDALSHGITGKAFANAKVTISHYNLINFTLDNARVDDRPYGGGPGMILRYAPLKEAISKAKSEIGDNCTIIYMSPQGKKLEHNIVTEMATSSSSILLICGRYEGIDQRIIDEFVDFEISIGDYVISCGEYAAIILIDAITRQIDGVLGNIESAATDSFVNGLLDCPHYTRPAIIDNKKVPEVLTNGAHKEIAKWRDKQSLLATLKKRPDLLEAVKLSTIQSQILDSITSNDHENQKD